MAKKIDIDIQHASDFQPLPTDTQLMHWAEFVLDDQTDGAEVCIRIIDEAEMQTLNRTYRNKDKPTNVLSFPTEIPNEVDSYLLGDIVVCAPVVFNEAKTQGKTYMAHFAHMIVHGCLHLLGYDHTTDEEANIMEPLEAELLKKVKIDNE